MSHVNIGGTWRKFDKVWVKIAGVWREVDKMFANIDGTWANAWESVTSFLYARMSSTLYEFNTDGGIVKTYNGTYYHEPWATNPNNDIFVVGGLDIYKLSSTIPDTHVWSYQYDTSSNAKIQSLHATPDMGVLYHRGWSYAQSNIIRKLNNSGSVVFTKYIEDNYRGDYDFDNIAVDSDGYIYNTLSYHGDSINDVVFQKRSASAVLIYTKLGSSYGASSGSFHINKEGNVCYINYNNALVVINTDDGAILKSKASSFTTGYPRSIGSTGDGTLYVGSSKGGINKHRLSDLTKISSTTIGSTRIYNILCDVNGDLYIDIEHSLNKYNKDLELIWTKPDFISGSRFTVSPGVIGTFPDKYN